MSIRGYFFLPIFLFCTLQNCDLPVITSEPGKNAYQTDHFCIYYDQFYFTPVQIERIGIIKENLLKNINAYLNCNYDGTIEVFISDTYEYSHASLAEQVFETPDYINNDNGHEIAHIVSFQELGYTHWSFLIEGIAVAAQTYSRGSAFGKYRSMLLNDKEKPNLHIIDNECDSLVIRIEKGCWNSSIREYDQAGAFMHYLKIRFGIESVKSWYQSHADYDSNIYPASTFQSVFNVSYEEAIKLFRSELINGSID